MNGFELEQVGEGAVGQRAVPAWNPLCPSGGCKLGDLARAAQQQPAGALHVCSCKAEAEEMRPPCDLGQTTSF